MFDNDLRSITKLDHLRREIFRHFAAPAVYSRRGAFQTLYLELVYQTGPYTFRLLGWRDFAERMPRHARRFRRLLDHHQRQHSNGLNQPVVQGFPFSAGQLPPWLAALKSSGPGGPAEWVVG